MYPILRGLRVIEGASFIAAPSCGLYLAQLGAEVIRFDTVGGGPDFGRWPRAPGGRSFYWEGLNKGKKSIAIDLTRREGRDLAVRLVAAPGQGCGIFLTNFPAAGFLSYDNLVKRRADLILIRVMGRPNGDSAVDYTVNCAVGVPQMTGPASLGDEPVNQVLPAWDLTTGAYAAFNLLAAERHRASTGQGQEIRIPLSDVAMATLGHLGQIAEVTTTAADRPRYGNDVFGAFGRDFVTADGERLMLVAITARQWTSLIEILQLGPDIEALERELGLSLASDEGLRFTHRARINPLVARAVAARASAELIAALSPSAACWGPYRTLRQALREDPDFSEQNPIFTTMEHASGERYLTPGAAASFGVMTREAPKPAPRLGEHTDQVLSDCLGLSALEIGKLHDAKIVAGP